MNTELFRLSDLIHYREEDDYYKAFGFEKIEIPDAYPIIKGRWEHICLRINEAYYDRFLAGETLEQWQRRIQVLTDRLLEPYERHFRLYQKHADDLEKKLSVVQTTTYDNLKDHVLGNTVGTTTDTPDTAINLDDAYAGVVSKTGDDRTSTRTGSIENTVNRPILEMIEENMRLWRDLETDLVDEFGKAFLSIIWY